MFIFSQIPQTFFTLERFRFFYYFLSAYSIFLSFYLNLIKKKKIHQMILFFFPYCKFSLFHFYLFISFTIIFLHRFLSIFFLISYMPSPIFTSSKAITRESNVRWENQQMGFPKRYPA